jgi:hypothetical protein
VEEITEEAAELVARVAALDIGKASLVACVWVPHGAKPGRRRQEVRTFATTTRSLLGLQDWLVALGVSLCVMEATSTYWKPPFYLLEDAVECWVVNARDVKNVPGRRAHPDLPLPPPRTYAAHQIGALSAEMIIISQRSSSQARAAPIGIYRSVSPAYSRNRVREETSPCPNVSGAVF